MFPTIDGKVVAGPTAVDHEDKERLVGASRGAARRSCPKAIAMYPPLADAEPVARLRRAAAGRARRQLPDRRLAAPARGWSTSPRSAPRADRVARRSPSALRDRRRAGRRARPRRRSNPGAPTVARPVVAANGRDRADASTGRRMTLLLGHRRGHVRRQGGAVRRRAAAASRGAAREGARATPARAGSSRMPRRCSPRGRRGGRGARATPPGEVVACGLDHQGESVLAWDAETGRPLTPIVTWQDKRSQEVLDRLEADGRADEVRERSGMPLDPYFSAGKLDLAARARRGRRRARATPARCASAPSTRSSATGSAPASPPTPRPPRAPSSALRSGIPRLLEIFGVPRRARCRRSRTRPAISARCATPRWPVELPLRARCVDQQAALAGAGCVEPGLVEGDLRHRRVRARPRRRRAARARRRAAPHGGLAGRRARSSGRSTAACSPPARCSSGSAATSGSRPTRPRSPPPRPRSRTRAACGCCRRSPGSARRGGAPTRAR